MLNVFWCLLPNRTVGNIINYMVIDYKDIYLEYFSYDVLTIYFNHDICQPRSIRYTVHYEGRLIQGPEIFDAKSYRNKKTGMLELIAMGNSNPLFNLIDLISNRKYRDSPKEQHNKLNIPIVGHRYVDSGETVDTISCLIFNIQHAELYDENGTKITLIPGDKVNFTPSFTFMITTTGKFYI